MKWGVITKDKRFTMHTDIKDGWQLLRHIHRHYPRIWNKLVLIQDMNRGVRQ